MSDQNHGLIERAVALLQQPGSAQPTDRLDDKDQQRHKSSGRAERPPDQLDLGRPRTPVPAGSGSGPIPAPIVEQDSSLRHLLRVFALHKFAFVATALLVFAAATVAILSLTPRYVGVAVVAIGARTPSVAAGIASDNDRNIVQVPPDAAVVQTQLDYLRSRPVAESAMDSLHLWDRPEFNTSARPQGAVSAALAAWTRTAIGLVSRWRARLFGSEPRENLAASEKTNRNEALDIFLSKLMVDAEPNSHIITIRFQDPDPRLAAAAANAVADQYIARQIAVASGVAQRATKGLEQAVAALRQRVAQSNQAYEQYRAAFEGRRELLSKQTEEATKELTAAHYARQVIEARLAALQGVRNPATVATREVAESRAMQALHEQAAALHGRLAELSTTLGDANPQIQQVKAAIARVNGEMRSEVTRQLAVLEPEFKRAVAKEASLRQRLAASTTQSAQSSRGQAELDALKIEADSNRAVLNAFLIRLKEANTSAKIPQRADAEIVAHANVPRFPAAPPLRLLLVLAALGSILAGMGVALAL
jgi:uncharacterized protein involved in exopolysaccharide biosynthesis